MKTAFQILCFILLLPLTPARADMTDWVEVTGGAVRLISTGPIEDGHYLAGLEFLLAPGWHTYWRYPGEAGVPPQLSVIRSENMTGLDILYPAPERYFDGFSQSIVYHDGIVLPIRIQPGREAETTHLSLEVLFGICKDICVPGDARLSLDFSPGAPKDRLAAKLIARDLAAVPVPSPAGDLAISSVTLDGSGKLMITATVASGVDAELFAAGPEGSYIGLPELAERAGTKAVWQLSTKGLRLATDDRDLRLVLSSAGQAVEHLEPIQDQWLPK